MKSPLVNHLHFDGMTEYGNGILLGGSADIPHLDIYTKRYLQELSAITSSLPDQAQPVSMKEYTKEVGRLREGTSSRPSDATPAMVRTEVLDPELAVIGWRILNFPWCPGYSPKCYQRRFNLLIHKDPNDFRPNRLRPILIFGIKANMHNKHLGRLDMSQAKTLDGLAPEQYGSWKAKAAEIQEINTRLFYDLIRQKIIPATSMFANLVSNYDLVVHSIASLSLQRVGVPKEPILCTFTTLQNMSHSVRTSFGYSKSTYGGETWELPLNPPP